MPRVPPVERSIRRSAMMLVLCLSSATALADADPAIADDGREVVLNEDGTWAFVSEDRFATTADGKRIRLKPDGTWEPADRDDAERYGFSQSGGFSRDVATLEDLTLPGDLTLRLDSVVIETARSKRGKNTLEASQMMFTVSIEPPQLKAQDMGADSFTVSDSRGKEYETAAVTSGPDYFVVRVPESPGFMWGIKSFSLTIAPAVFDTEDAVVLTKVKGEVIERDVEELSRP